MSLHERSDLRVVMIVGTRPEAIKLAPLALALRQNTAVLGEIWCTGQHAIWAPEMLAFFGLQPAHSFPALEADGLGGLAGTLLLKLQAAFAQQRPDVVVVQGDTASAFAGAVAAAYAGIPVVHVEAGLRSGDRRLPFPEEAHRRAIAHFTELHCAPTKAAAERLQAENITASDILLCGNTVIDALQHVRRQVPANDVIPGILDPQRQLVLVTCHRRESWGAPFAAVCAAMLRIARRGDCEVLFVLHPNPVLMEAAERILGPEPSVHLVPPLGYPSFARLLERASLILTDSGGVQEEASVLGTPLLVLRDCTERPEGLLSGSARLVGNKEDDIVAASSALLDDPAALAAMRVQCTLHGDGQAGRRIADAIVRRWLPDVCTHAAGYINTAAISLAINVPASA